MKIRYCTGQKNGTQFVSDLNGINGDQTGLSGKVGQKQVPVAKGNGRHYLVGGKWTWVNPLDAMLERQIVDARTEKATFQGQEEAYRSLRVQGR